MTAIGDQRALSALKFIMPILLKYGFKWVITGGFACYVYGVERPLTDIDIDLNTSKAMPGFTQFLAEVQPYVSSPFENFKDQNYDNYSVELTFEGQILDICPGAEMKIFNKASDSYEPFYQEGWPKPEFVKFHDLELPLLPKILIIKNKEMLVWQRESDLADIEGLKKLL